MKYLMRLVVALLSLSLLFPPVLQAQAVPLDDLKSDHHFVNRFAKKDGSNYYVNNGHLEKLTYGLYKVSNDMQKFRLIKQGQFMNIMLYKNTLVTFNETKGILQRFSFDGTLVREYPEVTSSNFLLEGDRIYYHTGQNFYEININGTGNKHLYTSKGTIQEFTIHNGWLYNAYLLPVKPASQPYNYTMGVERIKISQPKNIVSIFNEIYSIDSLIVRDGYIYSVIVHDASTVGRNLYRMDYSGNHVKRVSSADTSDVFVGSKYVYYVENYSGSYTQSLYRMTLDGKNRIKVGDLTGSKLRAEYHNGSFYFEVQNVPKETFYLRRILQKQ